MASKHVEVRVDWVGQRLRDKAGVYSSEPTSPLRDAAARALLCFAREMAGKHVAVRADWVVQQLRAQADVYLSGPASVAGAGAAMALLDAAREFEAEAETALLLEDGRPKA